MGKSCGAKTRSGGECSLPAGHQTIHPGVGRCKFHEETDPVFPYKYRARKVKNGYGICRDKTELRVYKGLNSDTRVRSYEIEPFEIPYYYGGEERYYRPDLLIYYSNGCKKLVEIKSPGGYTALQNIHKYIAAIVYAETKDLIFEVWVCSVVDNKLFKSVFTDEELMLMIISKYYAR